MKTITLKYLRRDSWGRPVYFSGDRLYVDVNPCKDHKPDIHTKYNNTFDGEPDLPVNADFVFVPKRDVWW